MSNTTENELIEVWGIGERKVEKLNAAGYETLEDLEGATADELEKVTGIGPAGAKYLAKKLGVDRNE